MGWCELLLEFGSEVLPVKKPIRLGIFRLLFPFEYLCGPFRCLASFHVGHSPHDLCLLVSELVRAESDIGLAGVYECQTFSAFPIKVRRQGRFGPLGFRKVR